MYMYDLLTGPGLWLSIGICLVGLLARGVFYVKGLNWQLDRVAYTAHPIAGIKGALRSIFFWILPFGTRSWRTQPFMTVLFFVFHIGAVGIPLFLFAHNMMLQEKLGFSFVSMNQTVADVISWGVIFSAIFLTVRRMVLPEVRILTTPYDYLILFLSAAPFITGLICRYEIGDYSFFLIVHILFGEILLISIPFTKLSHILLFFLSRAQLGMDFGIKRGGMKGKGLAW
jgi:nitrate reductase gamma subunit